MGKFKALAYLFIGVFLVSSANAASIHGIVYDLALKKVDNAMVEINTSPRQFMIAQNGSYAFNVANGNYVITAKLMEKNSVIASVQENITIKQPGDYVLDLILFPDIEEGVEEIDIEVNGSIVGTSKRGIWMWLAALFVLVVLVILYYYANGKNGAKKEKSENKKTEETYEYISLEQIIKIIRQEGGRATQKEIRKQIPLSEAKISLMIAELEHKGVIEKIKKGRGNIIILRKNKD